MDCSLTLSSTRSCANATEHLTVGPLCAPAVSLWPWTLLVFYVGFFQFKFSEAALGLSGKS